MNSHIVRRDLTIFIPRDPALIKKDEELGLKRAKQNRVRGGSATCVGYEGYKCDRKISANKMWCNDCYDKALVKMEAQRQEALLKELAGQ